MPLPRRRQYRRRRPMRRRRPNRKVAIRRRQPRLYNFKRSCELKNITTVALVTPTEFQYTFRLSDLPGVSEFTALFDQYRIKGVRITFYPPVNVSFSSTGQAPLPIGEFYTAIDYDDGTVPTGLDDLQQYQTLRRTYFNRPHTRYLRPLAIQSGVYQTGVSTGFRSLPSSTWFDCGYPDVSYYGIKGAYAISQSNLQTAVLVRCTATYYLQFRKVR